MNIEKIQEHYDHAREKHPYFCDWIGPNAAKKCDVRRLETARTATRTRIADAIERGNVGWDDLLDCEVWEVFDALIKGDKAQAVEELYDCIAIILRTIDVLEGRQKLDKPETKG